MNTYETPCPSCAQTIHFPIIDVPIEQPAITSRVRCPSCRVSLKVWLNRLAIPSPNRASQPEPSHTRSFQHDDSLVELNLSPSSTTQVSTAICPHCRQRLVEYRFAVNDGFSIVTYHCAEHGDVIPSLGASVLYIQ